MYIEYNSNPENKLVGDCVVRAISKVTDQDWERTYMEFKQCLGRLFIY